jgi:LDH2 family malate/lactate/ureidoglycolate dehydrogenase
MTSAESLKLDDGARAAPCHGELILAFDPRFFSQGDAQADRLRAEQLFDAITGQGARRSGAARAGARQRSLTAGVVQIPQALLADVQQLLR